MMLAFKKVSVNGGAAITFTNLTSVYETDLARASLYIQLVRILKMTNIPSKDVFTLQLVYH